MGWEPTKENGIEFLIMWTKWWKCDIGCTIEWNVTWDIQLGAKVVKNDVKMPNRWENSEKWAKILN